MKTDLFERLSLYIFLCFLTISFCAKTFASVEIGSQKKSWVDSIVQPVSFDNGRIEMKAGLESRYRFEYRDDFNFNDSTYEDDAINLFRNRLNLDMKVKPFDNAKSIRIFTEGQEAHSFAESSLDKTNAFTDQFDLRQLFGEMDSPFEKIPATVKVGRQELIYGDGRFIGSPDWSNVGRVFDAVKAVYHPRDWFQFDTFFAQVVSVRKDTPDTAAHHDNLDGMYSTLKPFKDQVLDTFLFIRHDRNNEIQGERPGELGQLKEYTMGNRFKGKKWNFDYGTEYALQFGSRAHDSIAAWAFHQEAGYTFAKVWASPRFYAEFNHASGDRNPSDGQFNTFDNLFPSNHDKYGFMDLVGLKNINDIRIGNSLKPHSRLSLISDFHWFFLDAKESPWFSDNGGVLRAANPNANTQLGEELDLLANIKITEHLNLLIGYGHFFAGPFTRDTGANDDANFFYTQTTFKI